MLEGETPERAGARPIQRDVAVGDAGTAGGVRSGI